MGLTNQAWKFLYTNKGLIKGKRVLCLGNPFPVPLIYTSLPKQIQESIKAIPITSQAKYLFFNILEAQEVEILDITDKENADIVMDLNIKLANTSLRESYDIIFDGGTQEHVFNNSCFIESIFSMLKVGGYYIFDLPANNWLDHGFRQYSPSFFYELSATNSSIIRLCHLSLHWRSKKVLNTLPLYKRLDQNFDRCVSLDLIKQPSHIIDCGALTSTAIGLVNKLNSPTLLLGCISKKLNSNLSQAPVQWVYRSEIGYKIADSVGLKLSLANTIKSLILNTMPAELTIKIIAALKACKLKPLRQDKSPQAI